MSDNVIHRWIQAGAAAILLSGLLFAWQWKYGFNLGDEGLLWYISQRIHFGEMPIRDVFGYDPGRYIWSAAWFKILGSDGLFDQRLANAAFGMLGLASAYASMHSARIRAAIRYVVVIALAIALCYPLHKVYEQSLSLIGVALVACVLRQPTVRRWWIVLGISTGIAACIGRNSGLFYAIATCAALGSTWRLQGRQVAWHSALRYAGGVIAGYAPMLAWFVADGRFRHAMIESLLFTPKWEIPLPIPFPWRVGQGFSSVHALQATMISWLVVLAIVLYLIHAFRLIRALSAREPMTALLALEAAAVYVGLPYLYQSFGRADFPHIAQGFLPLFILAGTQLTASARLYRRLLAGIFLTVAMMAWLPSLPGIRFWLLQRGNANATGIIGMDGHRFVLGRGTAMLLQSTRRVAEACHVGDGQFVAMPHYPGLLAYLHVRSPYWEMYYLYPRSRAFQEKEIRLLEKNRARLAVVNASATIDGRKDMRLAALDPILLHYIRTHFSERRDVPGAPGNVQFLVRNCSAGTSVGDAVRSSGDRHPAHR